MKKTFFLCFSVVALLTFSGCNKDDSNSGGDITIVEWVDLGLPSGLLWATCNVGASASEEYGDYFAWGETQPKEVYDWDTYAYGNASNQLTKYCHKSEYGLNGFTDNLTTLEPDDDAATVRLGNGARTPTADEWQELIDNTTSEWTTKNGVNGRRFIAANGNSVFLPAAGQRENGLRDDGVRGFYWSASLGNMPFRARFFKFGSSQRMDSDNRHEGYSVRAVRAK